MNLKLKSQTLKKFSLKKMKNGQRINLKKEDRIIHTPTKENIVESKMLRVTIFKKSESH